MTPYEKSYSDLEVSGGQVLCVGVPWALRGVIDKLIVTQYAGTNDPFTVTLFNREHACEGVAGSDSEGGDTGTIPPEHYEVIPPKTGTNGIFRFFAADENGFGYSFANRDGPNNRNAQKIIYIKIAPQGEGEKKFAVTIGGMSYSS